jgi:hypothetical protein
MDALKSESLVNTRLVLESNKTDEWWNRTIGQCERVLEYNPKDWEVMGSLGLLKALGGKANEAKELISRAMDNDLYVKISFVFYYKTQGPYRHALELAGMDMEAAEAKLAPGERMQLENRLARVGAPGPARKAPGERSNP